MYTESFEFWRQDERGRPMGRPKIFNAVDWREAEMFALDLAEYKSQRVYYKARNAPGNPKHVDPPFSTANA